VAVTGAKACVFRVGALESKLQASWDAASCNGVFVSPADMTTDLHGSAEYRAALIPVLAGRAVAQR
jgi:carbon-monoxide dehydrogenase medium subunit